MAGPRYGRLIALGALVLVAAPAGALAGDAAQAPAGMIIYRDPTTGALTEPPPGTIVAPSPRAVEPPVTFRQGITPGGGTLVDGLPWNTVRATADGAGKVTTHCEPSARDLGSEP